MTKKILSTLLVLTLFISLFCGCTKKQLMSALSIDIDTYDPSKEMAADILKKTVSEEGKVSGNFTYTLYTDGTASVTSFKGSTKEVTVPSVLDGHTVVALDNKALYKSTITSLTLPDTLQVVGNFACMYCAKLEKVTFGKEIENIGVSAFESEGDDTKSVGMGKLQTLIFSGKAPAIIREKAFYYCDKLTEIVLPQGIKTIDEWAFAKCMGAKRVILGDGLERIGNHAFLKCRGAKEISIPGSCKTVDVSAFYQCRSLQKLTIGNGVQVLNKGAFEECEALTEVTLPDSVTTLGKYAFYNCTALSSFTAGAAVTNLEGDIFAGDRSVKINAPKGSALSEYAKQNKLPTV